MLKRLYNEYFTNEYWCCVFVDFDLEKANLDKCIDMNNNKKM